MKTCDKTNERLAAFVLGYFSEEEVSEMTRHLVECEDCRVKVTEHGKLLECVRAISEASVDEEMCKSAKEAVHASADAEKIGAEQTVNIQHSWRMIMKSSIISKLAVAAMVVIAVVAGIHYFGATGVAWGQLVEKIESVESVVYRLTTKVKMEGMPEGQTPKTETIAYYSSEYGSRVESYIYDKLSYTIYLNPKENIFLTVMPEQKKFIRRTDKSPDELRQISEKDDPRVMVRHMMSTEYEQLGRDKINGIDVEGIECTGPGVMGGMCEDATARLWVEIGTDFPVRIEIEGIVSGGQMEMGMVMDDFQWDVELDPALFVPDIPSDYTSQDMNLPETSEGTAINGLRTFAELTGGKYPSDMSMVDIVMESTEAMTKNMINSLIDPKKEPEQAQKSIDKMMLLQTMLTEIRDAWFDQKSIDKMMLLQTPLYFYMQLVQDNKEPAYYGDKVTAEDIDLVLLRWKISDDEYRVIFGDLTTANISADQLAELEKPFR
jgi:hypothetical protein